MTDDLDSIRLSHGIRVFTSPTPLGRMLQRYRWPRRISQARLAEMLGFDHSYISRIESGTRTIHPQQIPMVAEFLGVDEADLALAICGIDPDEFRRDVIAGAEPGIRADERERIATMLTNPEAYDASVRANTPQEKAA